MIIKTKLKFLIISLFLLIPTVVLAQTVGSTNYQVEDGTFDSGGEPSSSTNYSSRDSIGDVSADGVNSTNYKTFAGFQLPAYPGIPGTPTLTNTGGTLYNSLDFIVATGNGQQVDTTYAIAISSDNFVTTYYIQSSDTLSTSEDWQTYAGWNSGTGERVSGLSPSTTYKIKVKARYGADSESGFSPTATATTAAPDLTITFSGVNSGTTVGGVTTTTTSSTNAINYGSLPINTAQTAAHQVTVSTNAVDGYVTTILQDGHLRTSGTDFISPTSGTNASPAAWTPGISTGEFGYHTTDALLCTGSTSRFASSNTYAQLTTSPLEVACNTGPVTSESTYLIFQLEIGSTQANGSYQNLVTYITTAQF
jgi:hypothetical protein